MEQIHHELVAENRSRGSFRLRRMDHAGRNDAEPSEPQSISRTTHFAASDLALAITSGPFRAEIKPTTRFGLGELQCPNAAA